MGKDAGDDGSPHGCGQLIRKFIIVRNGGGGGGHIHRATGGGVNAFPEVVRVELGTTSHLYICGNTRVINVIGAVGR